MGEHGILCRQYTCSKFDYVLDIIMNIVKKLKSYLRGVFKESAEVHMSIGDSYFLIMSDMVLSRLLLGASTEDYRAMEFFRKSWRERNRFVTAGRNFKYFFKKFYTAEAVDMFDNKENFNQRFKKFIRRDWLFSGNATVEDIRLFVGKHKEVIVKPNGGCEGCGIYKLKIEDEAEIEELLKDINEGKKFLIEELIHQHPAMSALNPSSVNTLRLETCIDKSGNVNVVNSIVIMGTTDNCVNNTHSGGIMCHIDWNSGIIDSLGRNPKGERYFRNPHSGTILPGFQIPHWTEISGYVKALAEEVPSARLVGWDIAILENGFDIIEGNVRPGHCTQICDGIGRWKLIKDMI